MVDDFLKKLKIDATPRKTQSGIYIIDIGNSNEYGRFYGLLSNSPYLTEDEESSLIATSTPSIVFLDKNDNKYTLTLLADFDGKNYRLTIRENGNSSEDSTTEEKADADN